VAEDLASPAPASPQISNAGLAVLVFATLISVVTATVLLAGRDIPATGGLTGFATSDSGNVTLTINQSLNILVDGNNTINFGACTPRAGVSYSCASNDTLRCDGVAGLNCTGDTSTPQFIRVENVGNVNASVNVSTSCTAAQLIGGSSPGFAYSTTHCEGANVTSWTNLVNTGNGTLACPNLAVGGQGFRLYANVTIPSNANPAGCVGGVAVLTFSAIAAP
jgi:hypothetical protein